MDNSGSVVRIDRSNDPSTKAQGRFCSVNRIQKLAASARELIWFINIMRRWVDYSIYTKRFPSLERTRKLKPRFLEYWQEACEFLKKEILARYKFFAQVGVGFRRIQLVKKENIATSKLEPPPKLREEHTGPPKGFIPLPDTEIGGCARNDSLIAPAI
jgi:hypothetical protein